MLRQEAEKAPQQKARLDAEGSHAFARFRRRRCERQRRYDEFEVRQTSRGQPPRT